MKAHTPSRTTTAQVDAAWAAPAPGLEGRPGQSTSPAPLPALYTARNSLQTPEGESTVPVRSAETTAVISGTQDILNTPLGVEGVTNDSLVVRRTWP